MPVNGPGGPTGPRPSSNVNPSNAPAAPPAAPAAAPVTTGWTPGAGGTAGLNLSLPPDFARTAAASAALAPSPAQQQLKASFDTFNSRVEVALHHDAMSLARGQTPVREGDPLTDAQQAELKNAATDLFKSVPVGMLAPDAAAAVQDLMKEQGLEVRDLASMKLGDLGKAGGDVVKGLVNKLKDGSPTTYYSLAATAAAAAGYAAWTGGSARLNQLGIRPEVKQGFLDGRLTVKLGAEFDAHLKNFKATTTVAGTLPMGDAGRLSASVTANSAAGFQNATLGYNLDRPNFNLSANTTFDRDGLATANAAGTWRPNDDLRLSAGVAHNFRTDTTTANLEATWKARDNVNLALSASHDSRGESRVGVGVQIRF